MPELPEVEFAARRLRQWAVGRAITRLDALPGSPLRDVTPDDLRDRLTGRRVTAVRRHGKQMSIDLDDGQVLLSHLGMTGKWLSAGADDAPRKGVRLRLWLDDGTRLDYLDTRRIGHLRLLGAAQAGSDAEFGRLGPDALELCARDGGLAEVAGGSKRAVKVVLMDQGVLAGVGNIYAAEALWEARVSPFARAVDVDAAAWQRVAAGIVATMTESLAREKDDEIRYLQDREAQNPFHIYGRAERPCPRCSTPIVREVQQGRSTFYCPACQPDPR